MAYGLHFTWHENDPFYVEGFIYLTMDGSRRPTIVAEVSRQWNWGFGKNKKYTWTAKVHGRDAQTGKPLGGYFDTREEAVQCVRRIMASIYHDPRDDGPQPKDA